MFNLLPPAEERVFKNEGILTIVSTGAARYGECCSIPHKIVYRSIKGHYDVFTFSASFTTKTIIIDDLTVVDNILSNEAVIHMFTGWALERLKSWVALVNKEGLILTSKLPHITEWFIEHKYIIKSVERNGSHKRFMGVTRRPACQIK